MDHAASDAGLGIATGDAGLLAELLRLCAAAGVTPDVVEEDRHRDACVRAGTLLLGADRVVPVSTFGRLDRCQVVVVSTAPIEQPVWQAALRLHADDVFVLPADEQRLVVYLGDFLDGAVRGRTVGVIGGCGGAGASTFAAALALVSARSGEPTTIVDADPLAWGLELVLGCEAAAGLRWPDVARTEGRVSAAALRGALPNIQGLAVLSWSRDAQRRTDPDVARTMLQAAQRGSTLVVVDLPRAVERSAARLLDACDVVVLVVVSDVHGIASAAPVRAMLRDRGANVRLVVRDAPGSDLGTSAIESRLGTTVVGRLPTRRSIRRAVEAGLGPLARGGIERQCRAVLSRLSSAQGAL